MGKKIIGGFAALLVLLAITLKLCIHVSNDAPLQFSAENGYTNAVNALLYLGADVHADQDAAVILAVTGGHTDVVATLIDHGANSNKTAVAVLTRAINGSNAAVVKLVLEHTSFVLYCINPLLKTADRIGNKDVIDILHQHINTATLTCDAEGRPIQTGEAAVRAKAFAMAGDLYRQADQAETNKDYATAVRLYRQSADLGFSPAQNDLGILYARGWGTQQDGAEAIKLFRLSADQRYAPAEAGLAYAYLIGLGTEKNYTKALEFYQKAANDGSPEATTWVGWFYLNGYGTARDPATAVKWFQKAADQGEPTGQYELAWSYLNGYGVPRDHKIALQWFKKAYKDGFVPPKKDNDTIPINPDIFDSVSPYEEGPQSWTLWDERVAHHFLADTKENYGALEKWCSEYSQNKTKSADGNWVLDYYLSGFESYFRRVTSEKDSWDTDHKKIQNWLSLYPQSTCAPIVEEMFWSQYAWKARGHGYANTVTPDGWKLFYERLRIADKVLDDHSSLANISPVWYAEKINVGLGLQTPKADMLPLLAKGLQLFPDYFEDTLFMEGHFVPRWGGSWKDVDAYIQAVVAASDRSQKRIMYARLYWDLGKTEGNSDGPIYDHPSELFHLTTADWQLIKGGFEDLSKIYPDSAWNLNNYASMACKAGDKQTYALLRAQLKGDKFYSEAWAPKLSMDDCDKNFRIFAPL